MAIGDGPAIRAGSATAGATGSGRAAVRVLVVAHEPLVRRGLAGCLAADPASDVIATAGTAGEGYRLADELLPEVALIGTTLPDAPGLAAATEFRTRFPSVATIVVAAQETDDGLFAAIRAGARAYCGPDMAEAELARLVGLAAAGEYPINDQLLANPRAAARVLEQFRTAADAVPSVGLSPLTDRELEILKRMAEGLTNAEIGHALGISAQTVKNHVTSILRKLAVNDRTQAVVTALKRGWIMIDDGPAGR